MSRAGDINTLFRRFGGNADTYQEIVAGELASAAEQKWPLLGQVRPQGHHEAPASRKGATAVGDRKVQAFMQPPDDKFVPPQFQSMVASPVAPLNQPEAVAVAPAQRAFAAAPVTAVQSAPQAARAVVGGGAAAREPLPTLFGRAAAASAAHVADALPPHLTTPVRVASPVVVPPAAVNESVGASAQPVRVSQPDESAESDLQAIFNRLVPPKVEPPVVPSAAPLKRLVKW